MSKQLNKRLVLVDGSSFLFRAYHAIPPLASPQGKPTNAIFGVANMLRKLITDHGTDYFTVVFDAPGKTFRHDLYSNYKANRGPMPDDLKVQIEPLHQLIKAMGLPLIMETGVEADDVLGVLAQYAANEGFEVVISTGDKDMAQLVNAQITLENTMAKTIMDTQGVIDKFGVKPCQIIDYLALMGDASDNIPGVAKVGSKTAAKWLATYQTLENLIDNAEQIKGKVGENLRSSLDQLPVSKALTTIKCDLDLPYLLVDLKCQTIDTAKLKHQLEQLGFTSWLKEVTEEITKTEIETHYETVFTQTHFNRWLKKLNKSTLVAFDTETTSLNYIEAEIVGISFAVEEGKAAYVPLAHHYPNVPKQLDRSEILNAIKPLLENAAKAKVGQNLKYDANVLANYGIEIQGIEHDTMLASYTFNSTATKHNMDDLAKTYLGLDTIHYEAIAGKGVNQRLFSEIPIEQASPYAAEDADITLRLHHTLSQKIKKQDTLEKLYREVEIPLIPVLSRIERNGVLLDSAMLAQQSLALSSHIIALKQQAHDLAGQVFNLGSPKQIQEILYHQQKLPVLKKTPKGQPSTAESVLQELANQYPLPKLILEYRRMSKLKSTYTDKLPQQVSNKTGRVHTSYHQAVTATGRLSSSNPNLQNIPIRTAEGRKIREAFIASAGHKLIAADYSQIELRIMAHLSGDEGLLNAFSEGADIHSATAAEVFGRSVDQITTELRRSAKAINFGLIYGMSSFGLAQQLGITRSQAQAYIDLYFVRYPNVKRYMDNIREQAKQQGYVETLFGRRLYLPEIHSRNVARRQYAERTAINAPMQGTAADIIKIAMINMDQWLQQNQATHKLIMQVHDELVFEVKENQADDFSIIINNIMGSAAQIDVPLIVDIGIGNNWDEAH